jgi:hypothetical protein
MNDSQHQKNLYEKILQSSAYINKVSRSGAGNYIITSKQVSDMISEIMSERIESRKKKIKTILEWNKWEIK